MHEPRAQTWPAAHITPHAPQFAGSKRVSTHLPAQIFSGEEQPPLELLVPVLLLELLLGPVLLELLLGPVLLLLELLLVPVLLLELLLVTMPLLELLLVPAPLLELLLGPVPPPPPLPLAVPPEPPVPNSAPPIPRTCRHPNPAPQARAKHASKDRYLPVRIRTSSRGWRLPHVRPRAARPATRKPPWEAAAP